MGEAAGGWRWPRVEASAALMLLVAVLSSTHLPRHRKDAQQRLIFYLQRVHNPTIATNNHLPPSIHRKQALKQSHCAPKSWCTRSERGVEASHRRKKISSSLETTTVSHCRSHIHLLAIPCRRSSINPATSDSEVIEEAGSAPEKTAR